MPPPDFASFESELTRLAGKFDKEFKTVSGSAYPEARLRDDYLNPLLRALGWDLENAAGLIQSQREVEIESRTDIDGRAKRADYLFRTDARARFVCEAKKPFSRLGPPDAFQAKRYAFNMDLPLAVLSDFEEIKVYVVGGRPHLDRPAEGLWKTWHYQQYPLVAEEIWRLLARENVAAGSIDALLDGLPKRVSTARGGKARQAYLIRPDRNRSLDADFLNFLDAARHDLASSILQHNDRADVLAGDRLNAAAQHILDRLLFIRICEDRDIDTGTRLVSIVELWRRRFDRPGTLPARQASFFGDADADAPRALPPESLWSAVVAHFRALDHRPPGNVPFFNGQLFKPHFSEDLLVGDRWLADFIATLSDDESPYLFNIIPVEILGSVYERFLGKVIRPHGRGVKTEEKPEVRKAGGVYYTPRYIVDYIVEQTVGKLVGEIAAGAPKFAALEKRSRAVRVLDPACGSGSFLIRAFERMCEHWLAWFTAHPEDRRKPLCRVDDKTGDVHLTVELKRQILCDNIFGVDLDAQAVEVTQLSLYLKMLEGETRQTLAREFNLEKAVPALLPPLEANIKWGNSLIASDFSLVAEDLIRVRAFDWPVQFREIMRAGGFDAVIGNPPYIRIQTLQESDRAVVKYFKGSYKSATRGNYDIYVVFVERALGLLSKNGKVGYIVPNKFFNMQYGEPLRALLAESRHLNEIVHFGDQQVFQGASTYTCLLFLTKSPSDKFEYRKVTSLPDWRKSQSCEAGIIEAERATSSDWSFGVGTRSSLMEHLRKAGPTLGEFAEIFVGLQTSADTVFLFKKWDEISTDTTRGFSKELGEWVEVESSLLKSVVRSGAIGRYWSAPEAKVLFPYHFIEGKAKLISASDFASQYPKAWAYLGRNKTLLANREHGKFKTTGWYQLYPKNLNGWERPKLLAPYMITRLSACLDATDTYFVNVTTGGFGIVSLKREFNLRYLCGILNSGPLNFYLKEVSTNFRGGYFAANKQFIEQLPIRAIDFSKPADRALHDQLITLVDKMLVLAPQLRAEPNDAKRAVLENAVAATDHQIDALVYQLYGLTPEEITLVEASAP